MDNEKFALQIIAAAREYLTDAEHLRAYYAWKGSENGGVQEASDGHDERGRASGVA